MITILIMTGLFGGLIGGPMLLETIMPLPRNVCGYLLFQNSSGLHVRD